MRITIIEAFAFCLLLAACASWGDKPDVSPVTLPPLVQYSPEFQKAAADELSTIQTKAPHVAQLVTDYGKLRCAIKPHTGC